MVLNLNPSSFFIPDFVEIQRKSFLDLLQKGLINEIKKRNFISTPTNDIQLIFYPDYYQLNPPEWTPKQAILKSKSYTCRLYVPAQLINNVTKEVNLQWVLLGNLPLMTKRGHFIINGSPRVIINQMIRSPGIYYQENIDKNKKRTYYADLISHRGSWLRLEIDKKQRVWARMKKTPKISILLFLQSMGLPKETIFQSIQYSSFLKNSFLKQNHPISSEQALIALYSTTHPKKEKTEVTSEMGHKFLFRKFMNPRTYDLGKLGRLQLNKKLGLSIPLTLYTLTPQDILFAVDYLINLEHGVGCIDDIDHLKNRRVRASGELVENQLGTGLIRLEKMIREKLKKPKKNVTIRSLITTKPINGALREFFGSSPLSQFMDQTNPLAEITHKRRLSSLGPGGISRETAGMAVRGIHPSHYGRICPIETPEGPNAGLVNSITTYAKRNSEGFLETPFYKVSQGQIQKKRGPIFFSADHEENLNVAPGDLKTNILNFLPKKLIPIRNSKEFKLVSSDQVQYIAISPIQMISIATSLIPFLEHDDANRALMGSNMQRQAVPLIAPERPVIGTGLEARVVSDSGHILQAETNGFVSYVSGNKIIVHTFFPVKGTIPKISSFTRMEHGRSLDSKRIIPSILPLSPLLSSWLPKGHPKGARNLESKRQEYLSTFTRLSEQWPLLSSWFPKGHPKGARTLESFVPQSTNKHRQEFRQKKVGLQSPIVKQKELVAHLPSSNFFSHQGIFQKEIRKNLDQKSNLNCLQVFEYLHLSKKIKLKTNTSLIDSHLFSKDSGIAQGYQENKTNKNLNSGLCSTISNGNAGKSSDRRMYGLNFEKVEFNSTFSTAKRFVQDSTLCLNHCSDISYGSRVLAQENECSLEYKLFFYSFLPTFCFQKKLNLGKKLIQIIHFTMKDGSQISTNEYKSNLRKYVTQKNFSKLFSKKKTIRFLIHPTKKSQFQKFFLIFDSTMVDDRIRILPFPILSEQWFRHKEDNLQLDLKIQNTNILKKYNFDWLEFLILKNCHNSNTFIWNKSSLYSTILDERMRILEYKKLNSRNKSRFFIFHFKYKTQNYFLESNSLDFCNTSFSQQISKSHFLASKNALPMNLFWQYLYTRAKFSFKNKKAKSIFNHTNLARELIISKKKFINKVIILNSQKIYFQSILKNFLFYFFNKKIISAFAQPSSEPWNSFFYLFHSQKRTFFFFPTSERLKYYSYKCLFSRKKNSRELSTISPGSMSKYNESFLFQLYSFFLSSHTTKNISVSKISKFFTASKESLISHDNVKEKYPTSTVFLIKKNLVGMKSNFKIQAVRNNFISTCISNAPLPSMVVIAHKKSQKYDAFFNKKFLGLMVPSKIEEQRQILSENFKLINTNLDRGVELPQACSQLKILENFYSRNILNFSGQLLDKPTISPSLCSTIPNSTISDGSAAFAPQSDMVPQARVKSTYKSIVYNLQNYQRSNQDTCLNQNPVVCEGEWIQKGDLLADGAASVKGELALGKNILIGYMPWEGYNFEDALLINERLIYDDIYTSIHIERYEVEIRDTKFGVEQITNQIPEIDISQISHLDRYGISKIGSWLKEGDILVGKVTPIQKKLLSPHEKLLYDIVGKDIPTTRDTSLRLPKNVEGRVVNIQLLETENIPPEIAFEGPGRVHIYVAEKRKIQVGDKMAGRHGNKGIVSKILPRQDMPYLPDGTPLDMVLNPLGVPSRMNVGQVFECLLGLAGKYLGQQFKIVPFDEIYGPEASRSLVYSKLFHARFKNRQDWLFNPNFPGKTKLFDGRTGESFEQAVTVGQAYMLKLVHLVDEKIHARSTGPYSLVTQQPLRGRSKHGGQRLGEMEVWALEGFGAAYTLQELLTVKSDDMKGRHQVMDAILNNKTISLGTPESFKVLIRELQSLCLDVGVYSIDSTGHRKQIDVMKLP